MPWFHTLTTGPYQTNSYLAGADDSEEAVLVDTPPDSFDAVMAALKDSKRRLSAILITHPHFDHTYDARRFPGDGLMIYAHADAVSGIAHPDTFGLMPEAPGEQPEAKVSRTLCDGDALCLAGLDMKVLEVPGHAPGSLAFHLAAHGLCFVGDLIFQASVGRTDLPGGDFDTLAESIRRSIYGMDDETVLYPGHGPPTDVGTEKVHNPFVRNA